MPNPVEFKKGDEVTLNFNASEFFLKASDVAAAYGMVMASWAWTEQWYSNVRAIFHLSDAEHNQTAFKDPRARKQQQKLLLTAAKKQLGDRTGIVEAALNIADQTAIKRNDVAHGIVAYCEQYPKAFVIFEPTQFRQLFRTTFGPLIVTGAMGDDHGELVETELKAFARTGVVYDFADFARISAEINRAAEILRALSTFCSPNGAISKIGKVQLLMIPQIVAELEKIEG